MKLFPQRKLTRKITSNTYLYCANNSMISKISEGVEISVESFYQADYSNPAQGEFMFAYRITISNHNNFSVKLLRRSWNIFDSNSETRFVEGEGVVGVQPVLQQGKQFQYVSGCNLRSEMGRMFGTYEMENLNNKKVFQVNIPPFDLIAPLKMN
jgi:ApaG protein